MRADVSMARIAGGAVAGLMGGLAASWAMNQVSPAVEKLRELAGLEARGRERTRSASGGGAPDPVPDEAPSTVRVARIVTRTLAHREVSRGEEAAAGTVVHFAFGGLLGALYGALATVAPSVTAGRGLLWGSLVWLAADEAALPLLGLSRPPTAFPPSTHALALAAHGVYGMTTEAVRRAIETCGPAARRTG